MPLTLSDSFRRDPAMRTLRPMEAVAALYSKHDGEQSAAIMASLSRAVFEGSPIRPAGRAKRALGRLAYRILECTTRMDQGPEGTGSEATGFRNPLLERSRHPYATLLLTGRPNRAAAALVEGGDAMNGPYMMLAPEIRANCGLWDRLFFDSVQCRDVQSRILWEARATYQSARRRLDQGEPVRLKAVAAGTGLSLTLVYDKLIRDGFDPDLITARITDRDTTNIEKANRLLDALASTQCTPSGSDWRRGISAGVEDIFGEECHPGAASGERWDVLTAIGILEYFQGCSCATTEQRLGLEVPVESTSARELVLRLSEMTAARASLIVNTYREDASTRILELFGKKFDYRNRENLRSLLASVDFQPVLLAGSGNIYDVEVYEKLRCDDPLGSSTVNAS